MKKQISLDNPQEKRDIRENGFYNSKENFEIHMINKNPGSFLGYPYYTGDMHCFPWGAHANCNM